MKQKAVFFILLAATALFYGLWWKSTLLGELDNRLYDMLLISEPKVPASASTVIVEIDERSLETLGQWPWPRVVMAQLLRKIASMDPSATAIDMVFPEPDRTSPAALESFYRNVFHLDIALSGLPDALRDNDGLFADAVAGMNVTLALFFDPIASVQTKQCFLPRASTIDWAHDVEEVFSSPYLVCNLPVLQRAANGAGHIQASADNDGIFRRLALFIRHNDTLIPTLGVAAVSTVDPDINVSPRGWSGDHTAQILGHGVKMDRQLQVLLRFYPRQWYRTVSALDVLNSTADPALFRGKFVFIGATAMGLHDQYTLSDGELRPGIYAHATVVENLLDDALIAQPSAYKLMLFLFSGLIAGVLMALMWSKKYLYVLGLFSVAEMTGTAIAVFMLRQNLYLSIGYFIIPLAAYLFVLAVVLFVIDYRDRKRFYEKMSKANEAMIDSMALVAETRDTETGAHIIRTKEYMRLLADYLVSKGLYKETLTPEYVLDLYHAAPLHDVGKVGIPDAILKKNTRLTLEEFEIMKTHTVLGKEIIGNAIRTYKHTTMLKVAYNIAYYHHEKWDGSGYPKALRGEHIPLEARMMALVDVYDALISRRCYKEPYSFEDSEKIIEQERGKHFDPVMVDAFVAIKEEFKAIALRIADTA